MATAGDPPGHNQGLGPRNQELGMQDVNDIVGLPVDDHQGTPDEADHFDVQEEVVLASAHEGRAKNPEAGGDGGVKDEAPDWEELVAGEKNRRETAQ